MSVTEITIKKSSSLRYYLTLANVNGTRAARLFELHLHCCILRYRCAPHNAAICILFQEDAEAREHRPGIPLVTDWSQSTISNNFDNWNNIQLVIYNIFFLPTQGFPNSLLLFCWLPALRYTSQLQSTTSSVL